MSDYKHLLFLIVSLIIYYYFSFLVINSVINFTNSSKKSYREIQLNNLYSYSFEPVQTHLEW